MTSAQIVTGIQSLCQASRAIYEIAHNEVVLVETLNNLPSTIIDQLQSQYSLKNGVIINIRREVLESLVSGKRFTVDSLKDIIQQQKRGKEASFRTYKSNFSILYPFFTTIQHKSHREFVKSLMTQIQYDLGIKEFTETFDVDFTGARNLGTDRYWFAIYNHTQKNQSTGIQFFGEFLNGKFAYGVFRFRDQKYLTPRIENSPEDFDYLQMISYFKPEVEKLENDIAKKEEHPNRRYWLYAPGKDAYKWDEFSRKNIMGLGWDEIGDVKHYNTKEEIAEHLKDFLEGDTNNANNASANYDFAYSIQVGDVVIAKKGRTKLLGYGEVISDYYYDDEREDFKKCRKMKWLKNGEWEIENHTLALKTLTDITGNGPLTMSNKPYYQSLLDIMNMPSEQKKSSPVLNLLKYKKQIILQGAPGTGKTKLAKELAQEMLGLNDKELEDSEQFQLIQFHASYTYEDFVRGIVSKPNPDGEGIVYEAENKLFAEFAKQALDNYRESNLVENVEIPPTEKTNSELEKFINHIIEKIDKDGTYPISENVYVFYVDDKRFKYKGDKWEAHPNGLNMNFSELKKIIAAGIRQRSEIVKFTSLNSLTRSHATYYANMMEKYDEFFLQNTTQSYITQIPLKSYVLIIDEINRANLSSVLGELIYALEYRGEAVESMYEKDGDNSLVLPLNLYIIGTMNTADRSVGHIDYAIRRRFAFVDVLPKDLSGEPGIKFDLALFDAVKQLFTTDEYKSRSTFLSAEFEPKDVALGHSYFIYGRTEDETMSIRLQYEIKPILLEYINDGVLKEEARTDIEKLQTNV